MRHSYKSHFILNRGIGLLELMLVLVIAAIILVIAASYYRTASNTHAVNTAYGDVETIIAAAQSYWNERGNHSYLNIKSIDDLIDNGYLSADYKNNPWGGTTDVLGMTKNTLRLTMENITVKGCNALAMRLGVSIDDRPKVCGIIDIQNKTTVLKICSSGIKRYAPCTGQS